MEHPGRKAANHPKRTCVSPTSPANPAGAALSASLMLDHLGEPEAAAQLDAAVDAVLAAGGASSTDAWASALSAELSRAEASR